VVILFFGKKITIAIISIQSIDFLDSLVYQKGLSKKFQPSDVCKNLELILKYFNGFIVAILLVTILLNTVQNIFLMKLSEWKRNVKINH